MRFIIKSKEPSKPSLILPGMMFTSATGNLFFKLQGGQVAEVATGKMYTSTEAEQQIQVYRTFGTMELS